MSGKLWTIWSHELLGKGRTRRRKPKKEIKYKGTRVFVSRLGFYVTIKEGHTIENYIKNYCKNNCGPGMTEALYKDFNISI